MPEGQCPAQTQENLGQLLSEAKLASEMLADENRRLKQEGARRDAELAQLRSKYADLLLKSEAANNLATRMELAAARLLRKAQGTGGEESDSVELLETLAVARRASLSLAREVKAFSTAAFAALETAGASAPLKKSLEEQFARLETAMAQLQMPLAGPVSDGRSLGGSGSILRVDQATRLILLDQGFLNGVRNGTRFQLTRGRKTLARIRVVESRAAVSAAILEEGDFSLLVPGTLLRRESPEVKK